MSIAHRLLAPLCVAISCVACAEAPAAPARVYTPVPTRADVVGPIVPPVYVHLVGSEDSTLERATDDGWTDVCAFPCDGYVPAFGSYRIAVVDRPSRAFTLPAPPGTWVSIGIDNDAKVWMHDSQVSAARANRPSVIFVRIN